MRKGTKSSWGVFNQFPCVFCVFLSIQFSRYCSPLGQKYCSPGQIRNNSRIQVIGVLQRAGAATLEDEAPLEHVHLLHLQQSRILCAPSPAPLGLGPRQNVSPQSGSGSLPYTSSPAPRSSRPSPSARQRRLLWG